MPLAEIKTYIDKNHHLPGVPSEREMVKNGLDVGEMNKLLMKKVEELTLYMIEKDKAQKEQENKITDLQQIVMSQQQRINQWSKTIHGLKKQSKKIK